MDVLRADNGKDFRSEPLRRGCREHNIELDYRPVATPHFGGHIKRLIGTMMGRIHLPGTTFANPRALSSWPQSSNLSTVMSPPLTTGAVVRCPVTVSQRETRPARS
jgi:transposase InsO family protein